MRVTVRRGDGARGVAEHARAVLEGGGGGLPAPRETISEQRRGGWAQVPDGDRRHGAESRGVEDEPALCVERDHDVVGVLVLRDDLGRRARWRARSSPREHRGERGAGAEGARVPFVHGSRTD